MSELSVLIVTYQSRQFMERCLSAFVQDPSFAEVLVWDNGSVDGTADLVATLCPAARVMGDGNNHGFSVANNRLLEAATGEFALLLNPDAFIPDTRTIAELMKVLKTRRDYAAAAPQLLNADGTHQVGDAGWRHNVVNTAGHFLFAHRLIPGVKSIYLARSALLKGGLVDVDWLCAACLLVRRDVVLASGGLTEKIFMYGEDVELGERLRDAGRKLAYVPYLLVPHLQGGAQKLGELDVFVSVKWLDALYNHTVVGRSWAHHVAFKAAVIAGSLARVVVHSVVAIGGNERARAKAAGMKAYAKHAWNIELGLAGKQRG